MRLEPAVRAISRHAAGDQVGLIGSVGTLHLDRQVGATSYAGRDDALRAATTLSTGSDPAIAIMREGVDGLSLWRLAWRAEVDGNLVAWNEPVSLTPDTTVTLYSPDVVELVDDAVAIVRRA